MNPFPLHVLTLLCFNFMQNGSYVYNAFATRFAHLAKYLLDRYLRSTRYVSAAVLGTGFTVVIKTEKILVLEEHRL